VDRGHRSSKRTRSYQIKVTKNVGRRKGEISFREKGRAGKKMRGLKARRRINPETGHYILVRYDLRGFLLRGIVGLAGSKGGTHRVDIGRNRKMK